MSSVAQLEAKICKGVFFKRKYKTRFLRKSMIDRALERVSAQYKLAMRILLFFFKSSVAQLEAEIYIGRVVFLKKFINPVFLRYQKVLEISKIAYSKKTIFQISSRSHKN